MPSRTTNAHRATLFGLTAVLALCLATACEKSESPVQQQSAPRQTQLPAEEIMQRVGATYAGCRTYRDKGEVTTVFFRNEGQRNYTKQFETAFVRPDRFRFEFRERQDSREKDRRIVHCDESGVRSWYAMLAKTQEEQSLGEAIVAASDVSGGSAYNVPSLLMPGVINGFKLTELADLVRLADATLDGRSCFKLEGRYRNGVPAELWIDQDSFLIRRIQEHHEFDDFSVQTTTIYHPQIDHDIPPADLAFRPPLASS